jgi:hypothetical protein
VTHPGQRLSALIDGELQAFERDRVLDHVTRCGSCRDEIAAIRALKRKLQEAVGEAAAGAGLTGRLMGLNDLLDLDGSRLSGGMPPGGSVWPPPSPPGGWPAPGQPSPEARSRDRDGNSDQRATRFFLAGSVAIFLAGLGTAAVIAGGEPQAQAPAPPVTPSIDVLVAPHNAVNPGPMVGPGTGVTLRGSRNHWSHPGVGISDRPGQP